MAHKVIALNPGLAVRASHLPNCRPALGVWVNLPQPVPAIVRDPCGALAANKANDLRTISSVRSSGRASFDLLHKQCRGELGYFIQSLQEIAGVDEGGKIVRNCHLKPFAQAQSALLRLWQIVSVRHY